MKQILLWKINIGDRKGICEGWETLRERGKEIVEGNQGAVPHLIQNNMTGEFAKMGMKGTETGQ